MFALAALSCNAELCCSFAPSSFLLKKKTRAVSLRSLSSGRRFLSTQTGRFLLLLPSLCVEDACEGCCHL